jgi:hypothetical protein
MWKSMFTTLHKWSSCMSCHVCSGMWHTWSMYIIYMVVYVKYMCTCTVFKESTPLLVHLKYYKNSMYVYVLLHVLLACLDQFRQGLLHERKFTWPQFELAIKFWVLEKYHDLYVISLTWWQNTWNTRTFWEFWSLFCQNLLNILSGCRDIRV